MTILDWFDILFDGIKRGISFLESIDVGGLSLADYIVVIFITSLVIRVFLNIVDLDGFIMPRRITRNEVDDFMIYPRMPNSGELGTGISGYLGSGRRGK